MMRRWKAFGKAVAGLCLAVSVSACANGMDFLADLGARNPASSGLVGDGKSPGSVEGKPSDPAEQPSFVSLYQTSLGPMLYRSGKLYSLATGVPKEWGPAPRAAMAWSLSMVSDHEGWSVGAEGISHYKNQVWASVINSSHHLLAPASNQGSAIQLTDVAFADASSGYAVGTHGTVLRYADGEWSRVSDATLKGQHFGTVRLWGASEVWVAGEDVLRFDGSAWESIGLPEAGAAVSGLLVQSDAVWASTGDALWRWDRNSRAWSRPQPDLVKGFVGAPQPVPGTSGTIRGWAMDVGTPGGILYQLDNAGAWTRPTVSEPPTVGLDSLVMLDEDTGYALSFDGFALYKVDRGTWSRLSE